MSAGWTHPMCWACWHGFNSGRQPVCLLHPQPETCWWCGAATTSGIYAREDPETAKVETRYG